MDNIYLLAGNGFMINKNLTKLKASLDIQYEELNVSVFRDMPAVSEVIDACQGVPFMSEKRLVVLKDTSLLAAKSSAEEGKLLSDYLEKLPGSTVLVMCYEGEPDRRRTMYKQTKKLGKVSEFAEPKEPDCVSFVMEEAKRAGAAIKKPEAEMLVGIAGCDYYALENEIAKLSVYSGGRQISSDHIKKCVSRSLEYSSFEIHSLLVQKKTDEAMSLLDDILMEERPEALIGLIAYNFREMFKVRAMLDLSYSAARITEVLKSREFIVRKRINDCKHFNGEDIRKGLKLLGELDYQTKSGKADSQLSLPQTLLRIYKI